MANNYTNRLKKRLPAVGDVSWDDEWHDNEKIDEVVQGALLSINRVVSGGAVTNGGGLTADYAAAVIRLNGEQLDVGAGNLVMTAAQAGGQLVNWLYINGSGLVVTSLTPPSGDYIPLALIDTDSAAIVRIADLRPMAEEAVNRDVADGVPGLTQFMINFMNGLGTIKSFFTNSNTVARTYTFQNRNGIIADDTDLALKAPLASPALTGTPTAPTAGVGTNTEQIATCAFVLANTSQLTVVAELNPEGGIMGGDVIVAGNVLTFGAISCMAQDLVTPLSLAAGATITLAGTVNQDFYSFIVRLVSDGTCAMKAYTTFAGPLSDGLVDKWRWIDYSRNNGSGVTMPYRNVAGKIDWLVGTNRPVLNASIGTSYTAVNVGASLPIALLKSIGVVSVGTGVPSISLDGGTTVSFDAYAYGQSSVFNILPLSTIHIKVHAGSSAAHAQSVTLRR